MAAPLNISGIGTFCGVYAPVPLSSAASIVFVMVFDAFRFLVYEVAWWVSFGYGWLLYVV